MDVSAWKVLPFNIIKKPILSALWYITLVHLIFTPFSTVAIIISSVLIAISFLNIRFYMGLLSPLPLIATVILSIMNYPSIVPIIAICAVIWMIIYIIALHTWHELTIGHYVISPISNTMKYDSAYYLTKDLKK